jgi:hypothetical protein
VMIKFIGHYETHVDMFLHYVTPLEFFLKDNPFLSLDLCEWVLFCVMRILFEVLIYLDFK